MNEKSTPETDEEDERSLRAEVERLKAVDLDNASLSNRLSGCELERDKLGAEVERLKADEARLDWLDKNPRDIFRVVENRFSAGHAAGYIETTRAAIDNAMSNQ